MGEMSNLLWSVLLSQEAAEICHFCEVFGLSMDVKRGEGTPLRFGDDLWGRGRVQFLHPGTSATGDDLGAVAGAPWIYFLTDGMAGILRFG